MGAEQAGLDREEQEVEDKEAPPGYDQDDVFQLALLGGAKLLVRHAEGDLQPLAVARADVEHRLVQLGVGTPRSGAGGGGIVVVKVQRLQHFDPVDVWAAAAKHLEGEVL